ncbi:PLP-dependent aminotransferase family protein [Amycolatopsis sp. NPDC005232]|uniref:MocR-like pyridoxine biosynthesis transcription factor PdxR n=1 Tax=Amycolatopsis sp. NPDC005232 TaxID=3157027 RepID=UPI0033B7A1CE
MSESPAGEGSFAGGGDGLHIEVRGPRVLAGLKEALRDAVRSGRLAPGARLPSSRALAADLGVARNTVVAAYAELTAEGWLSSRQGAATRVATTLSSPSSGQPRAAGGPVPPLHDLRPGTPDVSAFPRAEWLRAARRALGRIPDRALGYPDVRGAEELRIALAAYLARARGVRAEPGRIVICAGAAHGLRLIAAVLRARGSDTLVTEGYGLDVHRRLLAGSGLRTPCLPSDERGARTDLLTNTANAGAVLLTPSHQFPSGAVLSGDRRAAVIGWARRAGGLVVEDDYDGEFRYDSPPVGSLQALDPEHVLYLGTASKTLAPGLRLGWMVVPETFADEMAGELGEVGVCGTPDQLVLAELLESGGYGRHVRAMRTRYRRRRDQLTVALAGRAHARLSGGSAGLHAIVELPPGREAVVVEAAAANGLALHGISRYRHPRASQDRDAIVVGYATPSPSAWPGALAALEAVLR